MGWGEVVKGEGGKQREIERDRLGGGGYTVQCTDDVAYNCTLETHVIL